MVSQRHSFHKYKWNNMPSVKNSNSILHHIKVYKRVVEILVQKNPIQALRFQDQTDSKSNSSCKMLLKKSMLCMHKDYSTSATSQKNLLTTPFVCFIANWWLLHAYYCMLDTLSYSCYHAACCYMDPKNQLDRNMNCGSQGVMAINSLHHMPQAVHGPHSLATAVYHTFGILCICRKKILWIL